MTNTQKKIALIGLAFVVAGSFVLYQYAHFQIIVKRFPDLDPKVVKAAYKNLMKKAAVGDYGDIQDYTEEQMDRIFLQEVALINLNK